MVMWLRRLYLRHFPLHDAAWKPTGLRFTTARDYDYALASAGARRAKRRSATGKAYAIPRKPLSNVVRLQRRAVSK